MSWVRFVLPGTDQVAYTGTVLVTASGRETAPFPRVDAVGSSAAQ